MERFFCPEKLEQCKEALKKVQNLYSKGWTSIVGVSSINLGHYSPTTKSKMNSMISKFCKKHIEFYDRINLITEAKYIESKKIMLSCY